MLSGVKIALIGATGHVGSRILSEALRRGHQVTAIARNLEKLKAQPGLIPKTGDAKDAGRLAKLLAGHEAVISALRFFQSVSPQKLIGAVKNAGVKRLLVVGGAGSLEVAPGVQLVDTPGFPAAYKPESLAARDFLTELKAERELDWTFFSPSAEFAPGVRTGKFRLGGDQLLTQPDGGSKISMEDFAIAMLDELENPRHSRTRLTVGY